MKRRARLSDSVLTAAAMDVGFALSTAHGQATDKLMPISDLSTLRRFV